MSNEKTKQRIQKIFEIAPELKNIFLSDTSVEAKRENIRTFLSKMLIAVFEDNPTIPPLEWVLTRSAIRVFRNIVSKRNERLVGFSLMEYIHNILTDTSPESTPHPSADFLAELEHLLKGITGQTGVYSETIPAYLKHEGLRGAKLRSGDLSRMAKASKKFMGRYICGLEGSIIRKRSMNRARIMKYFNATDLEWERWTWHTRNIIRDADTLGALVKLTDEEYEAINMALAYKIPFGITPYYVSLMDFDPGGEGRDTAIRAQVIPSLHTSTP